MYLKYKLSKIENFGVDIVSVGNLNVGGSGKTPIVTALASKYDDVAVILRGYGRLSEGLHIVSDSSKILTDVSTSGDEAMIYATKLKNTIVIVSENRVDGIKKAKEMGAKLIFLDDGYSKHNIKKLDFLIETDFDNDFCLPSGPYRERLWDSKDVVTLREGVDFKRKTTLKDRSDKMSLITAIARPERLDEYLPDVVSKNYFADHHNFTKDEIEMILKKDASQSALVTYKDYVKLKGFELPLSLLDLEMELDEKIYKTIEDYRAKKD
jgi:tetraacyldisaccharide 4'-kinase